MDCLFTDKEKIALDNYIDELGEVKCDKMILYLSPDFNIDTLMPVFWPWESYTPAKGTMGVYRGARICVFDGLDSHTACLMPDPDTLKEKEE